LEGCDCAEEPDGSGDARLLSKLTVTIESEIIPRLLLAHKPNCPPDTSAKSSWNADPDEVGKFAALIIAQDGSAAPHFIKKMREAERPLENIILELLAPTAHFLGELWKADRCTFTEVTVGLSRLRQILREIAPDFENEGAGWRHGRRALLVSTPGEQHTFGMYVVESFFRRQGWDVSGGPICTEKEITQLVASQWFAIAGFSISSERFLDRLISLIQAVRRRSRNSDIGIMVGGPVFASDPSLVRKIGADATAVDGRQAVTQAAVLLGDRLAKH
jgi:methylmalonyl-CoA mutase cobalamin-binding domain/chain